MCARIADERAIEDGCPCLFAGHLEHMGAFTRGPRTIAAVTLPLLTQQRIVIRQGLRETFDGSRASFAFAAIVRCCARAALGIDRGVLIVAIIAEAATEAVTVAIFIDHAGGGGTRSGAERRF